MASCCNKTLPTHMIKRIMRAVNVGYTICDAIYVLNVFSSCYTVISAVSQTWFSSFTMSTSACKHVCQFIICHTHIISFAITNLSSLFDTRAKETIDSTRLTPLSINKLTTEFIICLLMFRNSKYRSPRNKIEALVS